MPFQLIFVVGRPYPYRCLSYWIYRAVIHSSIVIGDFPLLGNWSNSLNWGVFFITSWFDNQPSQAFSHCSCIPLPSGITPPSTVKSSECSYCWLTEIIVAMGRSPVVLKCYLVSFLNLDCVSWFRRDVCLLWEGWSFSGALIVILIVSAVLLLIVGWFSCLLWWGFSS